MCTLSLSDMGELRDEWLREPVPPVATPAMPCPPVSPATPLRCAISPLPDLEAVAA